MNNGKRRDLSLSQFWSKTRTFRVLNFEKFMRWRPNILSDIFLIAYLHCDFFRQRHQSTKMRKGTAATTTTKNIANLDKTRTSTFLMIGTEVVTREKSTKMGRPECLQMASKTEWRTTRGRKATRMLQSSTGRGKNTTRQLLWPTLTLWSANIKRRRRRWSWLFWISWLALPQNFVCSEKQSRLKKMLSQSMRVKNQTFTFFHWTNLNIKDSLLSHD